MERPKLIRITTVPLSLDKLLEDQLAFMNTHFKVVAMAADAPYLEKIAKREGVRWKMIPLTRKITPLQDLKAVYLLYRYLKKERPEIVHTHTPKAGIVGMLAARLAGVPHRLHTVAGLPLLETSGLKRSILNAVERWTYRCATRVYPNSHGLYKIIQEQNFTTAGKLQVIGGGSSNGIDTDYFSPAVFSATDTENLKEILGIPKNDFCFVFVGRLVADKGIHELVEAFVNLQRKHSATSLVLVGPLESALDPLNPDTLRHIEAHAKIFTTGYQNDVRGYYAFAKALSFPSYREGFPNVVLQAGAMGLPSIVSDINGCNEIITDGKNGIIVPPKNSAALQSAMEYMVENESKRDAMAAIARTEITIKYERQAVHKAILDEYRRLLSLN